MSKSTSWESSESWYASCVGEKGHYYHQSLILPGVLRLMGKKEGSLLDLGCGQGVLARALPEKIAYWGVDSSPSLIAEAKKLTKRSAQFSVGDVTEGLNIDKRDFDFACFILSLQNMEDPAKAIAQARKYLKTGGRLILVLNHPCFRIPRQSSWGVDESNKMQYRRVQKYMSSMKIPIQMNPSQKDSAETFSFHHSLTDLFRFLAEAGFVITGLEEWCSDKKSEGARAKMEDRARLEIPLFLALTAKTI